MNTPIPSPLQQYPSNQHWLIGQKPPLKREEIWAIGIRLQLERKIHDSALVNLAIDSILRACALVRPVVADLMQSRQVMPRACMVQQKTGRPVQFEITRQTREVLTACIRKSRK